MNAASPSDVSNTTVVWFPVVTLILGFAISSISDWVKNRRESERERDARREARREQLSDQRRNFQRETLLVLQEAIQDLARATGAAHHQDEMAFGTTGRWQRQPLGEELNQQVHVANRRVLLLAVRVRDESLRDVVNRFRQLTNETETNGKKARPPSRRDREKENYPRGPEPSRCPDRERSDRRLLIRLLFFRVLILGGMYGWRC